MHALVIFSNTPWDEITANLGAASTAEKNVARFIAVPIPPVKVPDVDALVIFSDTPWVEVANDQGAPPRLLEIMNWSNVDSFPVPPLKVPDVDALMIFSDTPWVEVADDPGAPPLFAPCSDDAHVEVPFPDWSFWAGSKVRHGAWRWPCFATHL